MSAKDKSIGETVMTNDSPVSEQGPKAYVPQVKIVQDNASNEYAGENLINHPKLKSFKRRETTPFAVKVRQEKEYLLSQRNKDKHDFILLMKEPNRNANEKSLRSPGEGAYSPQNPCVEALFLYDTNCSLDQLLKKEKRGDVIVDYNFTERAIEDAESGDKRIGDVISYVNKELLPKELAQRKIAIREKVQSALKGEEVEAVAVSQQSIEELYGRSVLTK